MDLPDIISAAVYTKTELLKQTFYAPHICLYVSGLKWRRTYDSAGNLLYEADHTTPPCLRLAAPGFKTELEYGSDRENWLVMMKFDSLQYDPETRRFLLDHRGTMLPLPHVIELNKTEVPTLRKRFRTIAENFASAIPKKICDAEIMTLGLLRRFLENEACSPNDAVEKFRLALDQDEQWEKTLDEHCRSLGIGRNTMRRAFFARYKISPGEYRTARRLQKINALFAESDLSIKEVAYAVGMKNCTHLNSLVRAHYGKTPSELCRELRHRSDDVF